jgi:hypothetical protein
MYEYVAGVFAETWVDTMLDTLTYWQILPELTFILFAEITRRCATGTQNTNVVLA